MRLGDIAQQSIGIQTSHRLFAHIHIVWNIEYQPPDCMMTLAVPTIIIGMTINHAIIAGRTLEPESRYHPMHPTAPIIAIIHAIL
jgi:hypothetical protein